MMYQIFNIRTQAKIGKPYTCRKKAQRRADKLDLEYGAIGFTVKEIEVVNKQQIVGGE